MGLRGALVLTLALTAASASAGEPEPELDKGARIRLRVGGTETPVVGRFVAETEEAIMVRRSSKPSLLRVPRASIETVEVAVPRRGGVTTGVLAGAALGGILGAGEGAVAGACLALPGAWASAATVSQGGSVARGVLAGTAASGAVGLALGLAASRGSGWFSGDEMIAVGAGVGVVFGVVSSVSAAARAQARWRPISTHRVRVGVAPLRRGVAAQLSVSF